MVLAITHRFQYARKWNRNVKENSLKIAIPRDPQWARPVNLPERQMMHHPIKRKGKRNLWLEDHGHGRQYKGVAKTNNSYKSWKEGKENLAIWRPESVDTNERALWVAITGLSGEVTNARQVELHNPFITPPNSEWQEGHPGEKLKVWPDKSDKLLGRSKNMTGTIGKRWFLRSTP